MKQTIKKLSALLLALVMVLALATVTTVAGTPVGVKYLDENGAEQTLTGDYITVGGSEKTVTCPSGWYVVSANATISKLITVNGDVNLILCDGATLTASAGIAVLSGKSLTIYAQSTGDSAGALIATSANNYSGIGGSVSGNVGTITINGGRITATGGNNGAGIGGNGSTVVINGGVVNATGGNGDENWTGAGIGASDKSKGHSVTINGGTVTAAGGYRSAGIGGAGNTGVAGTISITGGTIDATGGTDGAGIGAGFYHNNNKNNQNDPGSVSITGGNVTAVAGKKVGNYTANEAIGKGTGPNALAAVSVSGVSVLAGDNSDTAVEVTLDDFNASHAQKWVKLTAIPTAPATPTDATPTDATPTDATPTDATPTDATPTDTTKELTVTSPLGAITRVTVDGKDVDSKDYTVQGGTVVLSKDFIRNLAAGAHTIRVYQGSSYSTASYTAGENAATVVAATGITSPVSGNAGAVNTTSPKTADPGLALYGVLAISSTLGLAFVGKRKEH